MDVVDVVADPQPRRAARVVLLDRAGRVLLLRAADPARPQLPYWYTPGGGIEGDESAVACALRELYEETGVRLTAGELTGPIRREVVEFGFDGRRYRQEQEFFLACCAVPAEVTGPVRLTDDEVRAWLGLRWWSADELAASTERIFPPDLGDLVRELGSQLPAPGEAG